MVNIIVTVVAPPSDHGFETHIYIYIPACWNHNQFGMMRTAYIVSSRRSLQSVHLATPAQPSPSICPTCPRLGLGPSHTDHWIYALLSLCPPIRNSACPSPTLHAFIRPPTEPHDQRERTKPMNSINKHTHLITQLKSLSYNRQTYIANQHT
jgi:hypothetical protein